MRLSPKDQKYIILLGCLLIVGVFLRFFLPGQETIRLERGDAVPGAAAGVEDEGSTPPTPNFIEVHVAGAVVSAGVYRLEEGSRVYQAVEKAGGSLEEADLDRINLAQPIYDGQQIMVPWQPDKAPPGASEAAAVAAAVNNSSSSGGKININTATQAQLETLPGIGPSKAASIIKYREENGHFYSIDDLLNISGIGNKTLAAMSDLITVH